MAGDLRSRCRAGNFDQIELAVYLRHAARLWNTPPGCPPKGGWSFDTTQSLVFRPDPDLEGPRASRAAVTTGLEQALESASVLVSLFISFTLDPMLSAYWGDPPGHAQAPRRGLSRLLQRFNEWFDHQAERYGRLIAWALQHRRWMAVIALASFAGALALQVRFGGSSFLPAADAGVLAIDVRTPASASLEYGRLKVEAAATLARTLPETQATNSYVNPGGGRIYVDIGKSTQRKRSAAGIARDLRALVARLVAFPSRTGP